MSKGSTASLAEIRAMMEECSTVHGALTKNAAMGECETSLIVLFKMFSRWFFRNIKTKYHLYIFELCIRCYDLIFDVKFNADTSSAIIITYLD